MKYLLSIWLWCIGVLYFGCFLLLGLLFTFIFQPRTYDPWLKAMMRFLFKLIRTPVTVAGSSELEPETTYLFMANHVSLFDLPLFVGFIPVFFRGVEASYQFNWPLYGWFVRRYGNIGIERESIHSSIKSIRQAEKALQAGTSLIILPEGGRTLDGKLQPFKKLPFYVAQKAAVPIVPIGLSGLFNLKRKGSRLITPTPITIKFGEVIPVATITALSNKELRQLVRERIAALVEG